MTVAIINYNAVEWIDMTLPSAEDVSRLQARFPYFHPLNLEDIRSPIERPKVDSDEHYLFVVMHFPLWDSRDGISRASEVDFFVGRDYVITVHSGALKPLAGLMERCQRDECEREGLLGQGSGQAFYTLVDQLVDYIFPILNKVDRRVHAIEDDLFESNARRVIQEIALLRRDIISLRRIIRHQIPIMQQLEARGIPCCMRIWRNTLAMLSITCSSNATSSRKIMRLSTALPKRPILWPVIASTKSCGF